MQADIQVKFSEVERALNILKKHLDWDLSIKKLNELNLLVENQNFWDNSSNAQLIMREKNPQI